MTIPLITYGVQRRYKGAKPTIPWADVGATYRSADVASATRDELARLPQNTDVEFRAVRYSTVTTDTDIIDG